VEIGIRLIKIPVFIRRFGWLMLDGVNESAENMGRFLQYEYQRTGS
jgi:hypothetical protein